MNIAADDMNVASDQNYQNQMFQYARQHTTIQYCKEVNSIPLREESQEILVTPCQVIIKESLIKYCKEDVLRAIRSDYTGTNEITDIKYRHNGLNSWKIFSDFLVIRLPMTFNNNENQSHTQALVPYPQQIIIEFLIKEKSPFMMIQNSIRNPENMRNSSNLNFSVNPIQIDHNLINDSLQSSQIVPYGFNTNGAGQQYQMKAIMGAPALNTGQTQNYSTNSDQNHNFCKKSITLLEEEVNILKDKVLVLEKKVESSLKNQLNSSFYNDDHSIIQAKEEQKQTHDEQKPNIPIVELMKHTSSESALRYVCHRCHSQMIKEDNPFCQTFPQGSNTPTPKADKKSLKQKPSQFARHKDSDNLQEAVEESDEAVNDSQSIEQSYDQEDSQQQPSFQASDFGQIGPDEKSDYETMRSNSQSLVNYSQLAKSPESKKQLKKQLHMAFLNSDPLMEKTINGTIIPFEAPLETEKEFKRLCSFLEVHNPDKRFVVRREAATRLFLSQIIQEQPIILHISCHGKYEEKKEKEKFSLIFESRSEIGFVDTLEQEELKNLLKIVSSNSVKPTLSSSSQSFEEQILEQNQCSTKVVFVSACYSEPIGQLFKKANVPVVIAVSKLTPILDDIASKFTQSFYDSLIKGNSSIREAFRNAKTLIENEGKPKDKFTCCCSHNHSKCPWAQYKRTVGTDAACRLHTPNCTCRNRYKGYHGIHCEFFKNFHKELNIQMPIEKLEEIDPRKPQEYPLCCCKAGLIPHNEDQKFIIVKRPPINRKTIHELKGLGDEEVCKIKKQEAENEEIERILNKRDESQLDQILFPDLLSKQGNGKITIMNDTEQLNYMPDVIDDLQVIARNKEVQEIVSKLDPLNSNNTCRIVHIHGPTGVGKSAISRFAAKFGLSRHFFLHGAYYIDLINKYQHHSFIDAMYEKLRLSKFGHNLYDAYINQNAIQNLIETIKKNKILIILDNCKEILNSSSKSIFQQDILKMIEICRDLRIIIISEQYTDLDTKNYLIWPVKIDELSPRDAAKVLWRAAKESPALAEYVSSEQLSKHKIFQTQNKFKANTIIEMSRHLNQQKSLADILQMQQKEENSLKQQSDISQQYDASLCWMTNMTLRKVQSDYRTEINLLYLLCQFPEGLFESDLQRLSERSKPQIINWKSFIQAITIGSQQEESNFAINQLSQFQLITSKQLAEMKNECHYIPIIKFQNQINKNWLEQYQKTQIYLEALAYQASLSRNILRSLKYKMINEIDTYIVSSIIDFGIWKDNQNYQYDSTTITDNEIQNIKLQYPFPELNFKLTERNYSWFLDIETLKEYNMQINSHPEDLYKKSLHELCINTASIYLMMNKLLDADIILQKTKQIAEIFDDKILMAKYYLIETSRLIKTHAQHNQTLQFVRQALQLFKQCEIKDGQADCHFLNGIQLLNVLIIKFNQQYDIVTQQNEQSAHIATEGLKMLQNNHNLQRMMSHQNVEQQNKGPKHFYSILKKNHSTIDLNQKTSVQTENIPEYKQGIDLLNKALDIYNKRGNSFGIGKTILRIAELYLENIYWPSDNIPCDKKKLKDQIKLAVQAFRKLNLRSLEARALRLQAILEHKFMGEFYRAKELIEEAVDICKNISDNQILKHATQEFNDILDKIRIKASNVFIFAKAFPLVEIVDQEAKFVGTFTRHINLFRNNLRKSFEELDKVINVKFETLTRDILEYVRDYGCRVLHLSSDVFKDDCLCIEGPNGKIEYISLDQLKKILKPANGQDLNVDLVVLALPESSRLADVFVTLGVQHVVSFSFPCHIYADSFVDMGIHYPLRFKKIYLILEKFYANLIQENRINDALDKALKEFEQNEKIKQADRYYENYKDDLHFYLLDHKDEEEEEYFNKNKIIAQIYPLQKEHSNRLFNSNSPKEKKNLKDGSYIDSSKLRGTTNIDQFRPTTPFTGRHTEQYRTVKNLNRANSKIRIFNFYGPQGIGKSRFAIEVAYFIHARYHFTDGIFFIDALSLKTTEQLNQKLYELKIIGQDIQNDFYNKQILLILDNIDLMLKQNKTQYFWFIKNILQNSKTVKFLTTSKKSIIKEVTEIQDSIQEKNLKPLNDIEAADFIISYIERPITRKELEIDDHLNSKMSIHSYLQHDSKVTGCCGFPRYLEDFAKKLKKFKYHDINIINEIVPQTEQDKMRKWKNYSNDSQNLHDKYKNNKINQQKIKGEYKNKKSIKKDKQLEDNDFYQDNTQKKLSKQKSDIQSIKFNRQLSMIDQDKTNSKQKKKAQLAKPQQIEQLNENISHLDIDERSLFRPNNLILQRGDSKYSQDYSVGGRSRQNSDFIIENTSQLPDTGIVFGEKAHIVNSNIQKSQLNIIHSQVVQEVSENSESQKQAFNQSQYENQDQISKLSHQDQQEISLLEEQADYYHEEYNHAFEGIQDYSLEQPVLMKQSLSKQSVISSLSGLTLTNSSGSNQRNQTKDASQILLSKFDDFAHLYHNQKPKTKSKNKRREEEKNNSKPQQKNEQENNSKSGKRSRQFTKKKKAEYGKKKDVDKIEEQTQDEQVESSESNNQNEEDYQEDQ